MFVRASKVFSLRSFINILDKFWSNIWRVMIQMYEFLDQIQRGYPHVPYLLWPFTDISHLPNFLMLNMVNK